jgi:hypothetical protein
MSAGGYTAEEAKAAFLSVAESATAFSLDSERTGNIILAMAQMVSKGRVDILAPSSGDTCCKPI